MATRNNVQDFIRDVRAQTNAAGTIVFVGTLNSDGSVKITRNGTTIYPNVYWFMGPATATTDAAQGDSVRVRSVDSSWQSGDAQMFINSLV